MPSMAGSLNTILPLVDAEVEVETIGTKGLSDEKD